MRGIADPDSVLPDKHLEVLLAFTGLLIDLKLQLGGLTPEQIAGASHTGPITMERLNELTRLLGTLSECRDDTYRIRY